MPQTAVTDGRRVLSGAREDRADDAGPGQDHFGTRRLSFLKSRKLLAVVNCLGEQPTAQDACAAAGVTEAEMAAYAHALQTLATSGMIHKRSAT